jgi:hypothetical protein
MLDELIERYGEGAILTVGPYVLASGETLRWIVEIDGLDVPDIDVRIDEDVERPDIKLMILVHGDDQVELDRWHEDASNPYSIKAGAPYSRHGPAAVIRRLGDLR